MGFKIITLAGEEAMLSHVNIASPFRVGRYGVDLPGFERVGVGSLERALRERRIILVDEIGKMELFSRRFREIFLEALEASTPLVATIMARPNPFADRVKERPDTLLLEATRENRSGLPETILDLLKSMGAERGERKEHP